MKIKPFIFSAMLSASIFQAFVFAEPTENKMTEENKPKSVVTTAAYEMPTSTETTTTVTSALVTTTTAPSFYDEILAYVGEDNAAELNDNLSNDAVTIDKSTIDYSNKSMYTITTRDGNVFYLIINSSDGSVYFLNSVDTSDLTAMLSDSSAKTNNEDAINYMQQTESSSTNTTDTNVQQVNAKSGNQKKSPLYTIILVVLALAISGVILYIKQKKDKHNNFTNDDFLEDNDEESESLIEKYVPESETEEDKSTSDLSINSNDQDIEEYDQYDS